MSIILSKAPLRSIYVILMKIHGLLSNFLTGYVKYVNNLVCPFPWYSGKCCVGILCYLTLNHTHPLKARVCY